MQKNILLTGLLLLLGFSFLSATHAANEESTAIKGIKINTSEEYVTISWDPLDGTKQKEVEGYMVSWGENKTDVRMDKIGRQYLNYQTSIDLKKSVTFDRDEFYYVRVFAYSRIDRKNENVYGSQILKWKYNINHENEIVTENPNDPVITTSDSNGSESSDDFEFGILRATTFDTMARLSWSRPNLTSQEFNNFVIVISEKADLSAAILDVDIESNLAKARIDGLKPDTVYYAAGYFEKGGKRFGKSAIINFKTAPLLDQAGKEKLSRALKRIQSSEGFGIIINAEQYDDGSVAPTAAETNTTSTTSTTTTTARTTSSSSRSTRKDFDIPDNAKDINSVLRELRAEIGSLVRYEFKLRFKLREIQSGN